MNRLIQKVEKEFLKAEKALELARKRTLAEIKSLFRDGNQTPARTNMKLKFRNKIRQEILTGEEIKGEGNEHLEVALVDDQTGEVVDDGPEASASVEIVLLKGEANASEGDDWRVEEFNANIVPEVEGKQPLLAGNEPLKLQRGVGVVKNIRLRHHASKIRPSVFKLGARGVDACDGDRIKEAMTESFNVKDFRKKYHKKRETPSLSDEVYRLVNIRKGGNINRRLQEDEIYTVEDFLIRLLIDPEGLRSVVKLGTKKWESTVNNARACRSDERMYCYISLEQKKGVVFNVLGDVLGLYFNSHSCPTSMLSEKHKADAQELLASAYENWGDVKSFDDVSSLQQHLNIESTAASEMIRESSSRRSNVSFHSTSSTMNSTREAGGEDFGSFSTNDVEIYDAFMYPTPGSPFDPNSMFQDFDELIEPIFIRNVQHDGVADEPNADEQSAATAATSVESQVLQTSNPPKRWRKLFCVSKWFAIRKRVSLDVTRTRKRQKVG